MTRYRSASHCALLALFSQAVQASPSDQRPLRAPSSETGLVVDNDSSGLDVQAGMVARIALYPGSRIYPDDMRDMGREPLTGCLVEEQAEEMDLAPGVCLSGEYYARDNIKVLESARCADGSAPTLMFYQNRWCTGTPRKVVRDPDKMTNQCLWSEDDIPVPSYYWSLIYRCTRLDSDADASATDGARAHQTAEPRTIIQSIVNNNGVGVRGYVRGNRGIDQACDTPESRSIPAWPAPPNECNWQASRGGVRSLQIIAPVICSDGSRAQLILYDRRDSRRCWDRDATSDVVNSVMDVDDRLLNTCLVTVDVALTDGSVGQVGSTMFYCEGDQPAATDGRRVDAAESQEENSPVQESPRVFRTSHTDCLPGPQGREGQVESGSRPQTFFFLEPMTCTSLAQGHWTHVFDSPSCPDGSVARLALWREPGCGGMPRSIVQLTGNNCRTGRYDGNSSYMIWCDDERRVSGERVQGPSYAEAAEPDDPRGILSFGDCTPPVDGSLLGPLASNNSGSSVHRTRADVECGNIARGAQVTIYRNAMCPDGKEAKLAVWEGEHNCPGLPDSVREVADLVGNCTQICAGSRQSSRCSIRFLCSAE